MALPAPMLASPAGNLPPLAGWTIEPKWDGIRVIAEVTATRASLWSRNKIDKAHEFPHLLAALVTLAERAGPMVRPTEGVDRELGALLVGYHDEAGALRYAGKVGTGYTRQLLAMRGKQLAPLVQKTTSFVDAPRAGMAQAVWVMPTLVAQVKDNEMTASGVLRQPSYLGLRDDKKARDVRLEPETSSKAILDALECGAQPRR